MSTVEGFLTAARVAVRLLGEPVLAERWARSSAVDGLTVGGLAWHLARQLGNARQAVAEASPTEPIGLDEHFARSTWLWAAVDAPDNIAIRDRNEERAGAGAAPLLAEVEDDLAVLVELLPEADLSRPVLLPWTGWALTASDLLLTRLLELVVHTDDLAASVGLPTPEQDPAALEPVLALLTRLAVRRHGQVAVLRTLSRAERAAGNVSAFSD